MPWAGVYATIGAKVADVVTLATARAVPRGSGSTGRGMGAPIVMGGGVGGGAEGGGVGIVIGVTPSAVAMVWRVVWRAVRAASML